MTPHLTRRGAAVVATIAVMLAYGAWCGLVPVVLAAEALLVLVGVAYLVAVTGMWALEGGALSGALIAPHGAGELRRGNERVVQLVLDNRAARSFGRCVFRARCGSGIAFDADVCVESLQAGSRAAVSMTLRAERAGRWTVHGLHGVVEDALGLVRTTTYLPIGAPMKVWPAARGGEAPSLSAERARVALQGSNRSGAKGHGYELRELRDHAPGDSIRRVDWKATARRRVLTVREFEDEVVAEVALVVDVASAMRGGDGGARFEHLLELAQDFVLAASVRGDRLGLVSFDDELIGALRQGTGTAHYRRAMEHLLALAGLPGAAHTECSDGDVALAVADYLLLHERLDFRRRARRKELEAYAPVAEVLDLELLERWADERLRQEAGPLEAELRAAGLSDPGLPGLRRFARVRGIELPYRAESRVGRRAAAVCAALTTAIDGARRGVAVYVLSDLSGVYGVDDLRPALDLALARRARLTFAIPSAPDFSARPDDALGGAVWDAFRHQDQREQAQLRRALSAHGVSVVSAGPDTTARHVVAASRRRR